MNNFDKHYDVVIIGAGPVGLMAANLLGRYNIHTLIIEKNSELMTYPRAVGIDDEALRSLQMIGFSDEEINSICINPKIEYFSKNSYRSFVPDPNINLYGYPILSTFLQPKLESILLEKLKNYSTIKLMTEHCFTSYQEQDELIQIELDHKKNPIYIYCKYLLGCDGGKSTVRKCANLFLEGDIGRESWLVVDLLDSPDIQSNINSCKNETTRERPVFTVNLPGGLRRFETRLDEQELKRGDIDEYNINSLLEPFLKYAKINVIRARVYDRCFQVANCFSSGRVFLLGDAAHLLPPYGGQGMCSGIRDAVNLCWKLSFHLNSKMSNEWLQSYNKERREHIFKIIEFIKGLAKNVEEVANEKQIPKNISTDYYRKLKPLPFYQNGFFIPSRHAGKFLPQPIVRTVCGEETKLDEFLDLYFTIIGINQDGYTLLDIESINFWKELGCQFINIYLKNKESVFKDIKKENNFLLQVEVDIFADSDTTILVVRPDRFILASCLASEINLITRQIYKFLTQVNEVSALC